MILLKGERGTGHPALSCFIDSFRRLGGEIKATSFHFGEHDPVPVDRDDVDLAVALLQARGDDTVAGAIEKARGNDLAALTQRFRAKDLSEPRLNLIEQHHFDRPQMDAVGQNSHGSY